jgi:hypothetical protein
MKRLIATSGLALAAAGIGIVTPASADTATASTADTSCSTGTLPGAVQGRPATLAAGAATGAYIWHNSNGWHLAVTHPTHDRMVFTGIVKASRDISAVAVRDERNDVVRTSGQVMQFRFVNYGYIDGVDFRVDCAKWLSFSIQVNGSELPSTRVYLGYHGVHPLSDPFTIERH